VEASGTSAPIVGKWQGVHDCEGIAETLADAGFSAAVIVENIVGNRCAATGRRPLARHKGGLAL
jgi:hypothetical protein